MSRKLTYSAFDAIEGGNPVNVVSVKLGTVGEAYGVREIVSGSVLVAAGTTIPNVATGVYEVDLATISGYSEIVGYEFCIDVEFVAGVVDHLHGIIPARQPSASTAPGFLGDYRLNLGQLISHLRGFLGDFHGERFDREFLVDRINEACDDWAVQTLSINDTAIINLTAGVSFYDVSAYAAAQSKREIIVPKHGVYQPGADAAGGWPLAFTSSSGMDLEGGFNYDAPALLVLDGGPSGMVAIIPPPGVDGAAGVSAEGNLSITYSALPAPMVGDEDYPDSAIPATAHLSLANAAAGLAMLHEQDLPLFSQGIGRLKDFFASCVSDRSEQRTRRHFEMGVL